MSIPIHELITKGIKVCRLEKGEIFIIHYEVEPDYFALKKIIGFRSPRTNVTALKIKQSLLSASSTVAIF